LNQQQRIARIASTNDTAKRRIQKLQKKRVIVGVSFTAALVSSAFYVSVAYSKTFINLWLVLTFGTVCGIILSLLLPKAYRLNIGLIVLFAAFSMGLFFLINNNINVTHYQTQKMQISGKSTYIGRNASPYVSINLYSFHKKLLVKTPAEVRASKYVILDVKKGCFGYKLIDNYQLTVR
jgi:hypothetical protein